VVVAHAALATHAAATAAESFMVGDAPTRAAASALAAVGRCCRTGGMTEVGTVRKTVGMTIESADDEAPGGNLL